VILGFLRFLAYTLMFIFVYRVVVGAFRYIVGDEKRPPASGSVPPREPKKTEDPTYRDVKDAKFKDVPSDPSNPS
jgi:hypothetical protein